MLKLTYIKDTNFLRRYKIKNRTDWDSLNKRDFALENFDTVFSEGGIDSHLKNLKSGPGGYTTDLYDVTDWDEDIYILGTPMYLLRGLREKHNKKIIVNKKEFIALLELWLKLTSSNTEENFLEKKDDIVYLSGNGEQVGVHWADFKYDWEDEDEELYD